MFKYFGFVVSEVNEAVYVGFLESSGYIGVVASCELADLGCA
jgi:hypothetical protein